MNNIAMHDPILIDTLADMYFYGLQHSDDLPTVPGLALALGFNRVKDVINALTEHEEGITRYPEPSISLLTRCLTRIEDIYIQNGLKSNFPAALVKFCLGAYHDRQEKQPTLQEQLQGATNIQIVFEHPQDSFNPQLQHRQQPVIELSSSN